MGGKGSGREGEQKGRELGGKGSGREGEWEGRGVEGKGSGREGEGREGEGIHTSCVTAMCT